MQIIAAAHIVTAAANLGDPEIIIMTPDEGMGSEVIEQFPLDSAHRAELDEVVLADVAGMTFGRWRRADPGEAPTYPAAGYAIVMVEWTGPAVTTADGDLAGAGAFMNALETLGRDQRSDSANDLLGLFVRFGLLRGQSPVTVAALLDTAHSSYEAGGLFRELVELGYLVAAGAPSLGWDQAHTCDDDRVILLGVTVDTVALDRKLEQLRAALDDMTARNALTGGAPRGGKLAGWQTTPGPSAAASTPKDDR